MTGRIALVTPWYGDEQRGGAERQVREIACRLAARGHRVEVFSTCSRSFQSTWEIDFFPIGSQMEAGVCVHRFPVDQRNAGRFGAVNKRLLELGTCELIAGLSPLSAQEERIFVQENINSAALLAQLKQQAEKFDAILFTPYLYGTTLTGLAPVARKAFLIPCLHNEAYAYTSACEQTFRLARGILYLSAGEEALAQRLYGPGIAAKGTVVGAGIELDLGTAARDGDTGNAPVSGRFVLVLGRRDATKNTDLAVQAFRAFRSESDSSELKLVLAGPGSLSYDDRGAGIVDLGLVDEVTKQALLTDAVALFQPSRNESYSRVMMEAWACGTPVVVHGDCEATAIPVRQSGGGFTACTVAEWVQAFQRIDSMSSKEHARMAYLGSEFALSAADWERVIDRYELALDLRQSRELGSTRRRATGEVTAIHQVLPNLAYGDAVSDSALVMRNFIRRLGVESDIFVQYIDGRMADQARVFEASRIHDGDGIIYHHSIGSALTPYVVAHNGPRALIYHNITPPHFFEPYDEDFAQLLHDGLAELHRISPHFSHAWGDSKFNTDELANAGFKNVACLPLIVDSAKWVAAADTGTLRTLRQGGRQNILFVGRLAPNKCQHDLLEMAAKLIALNSDVRMCIVGDGDVDHPYVQYLERRIRELHLSDNVMITGQVTQPVLQAFYRAADVYVSMSEHEGFGVPLIEAMWFDVPVIAFKSSAIPETLGDAAVMFTSKADMENVAALVNVVLTDSSIRRRICAAQRRNRQRFTAHSLEPLYERLLDEAFQ